MRIICGIVLIACGISVFGLWTAGAHGHYQLRFHMIEDWLFLISSIVPLILGLYLLLNKAIKRRNVTR